MAKKTALKKVAPHVGAWIEINVGLDDLCLPESRPMWARGLKWHREDALNNNSSSRPMWARGLKSRKRQTANGH